MTKKIEPSKNELVSTNKTEDTSKMKCSICKQEGHNKRSCKKMTTSVSAPKIEAEIDVKVIPPVKVEMTDNYSSILQKAIDSNIVDTTRLTEKCGDVCIKDELDIISNNISKSWAPLKATIVSVIAKIMYSDWDTRNHQTQIGGKYSLRTIDRCYVSDYLYKKGLYDTSTEFALTRSFEKAEPFNKKYSGMISPKECKTSFLNIVEIINTKIDINLLNDILVYLITFLKNRKEVTTSLKNSIVVSSKDMNILDVSRLLDEINKFGRGSSVIPVIIAHTLLSVIQPYLWVGITMKPLKEHTAPDNHSKSYGDIEGLDIRFKPKIAIEVKHKISITDTIVAIFDEKIKDEDIPLKFIITTAKTERRVVQNNICIDTLNGFVISYLQHTIFHEKKICLLFIKELRTQIVSYKNMRVSIKESINEILTSLLVSPSL